MLCGDHQFFYAVSGRTDAGNVSVQCKTHMKKECRKNLHSFFESVHL